eukprot:symbB.v1.2.040188.t1/scaffold7060.1/size13545/1
MAVPDVCLLRRQKRTRLRDYQAYFANSKGRSTIALTEWSGQGTSSRRA